MPHSNHQELISEVSKQVVRSFVQRGERLMPLSQEDVEEAKVKAKALLLALAGQERELEQRLKGKVLKDRAYLDNVSLSGALLEALNKNRSSRS